VQLGLGITLQSRITVEQELQDDRLGEISVRGGLRSANGSRCVRRHPAQPSVAAFLDFVGSYPPVSSPRR
jgi:hypothetical protein